jgi:SM-20-related protein
VICYLNNDWTDEQGGQLRMYLLDRALDILPQAGKLVCFRSDQIEHEVLPATRPRMSITGWMLDQLVEMKDM